MSDPRKFDDELSFYRAIVNAARDADEHNPLSMREAKQEIALIKKANPHLIKESDK